MLERAEQSLYKAILPDQVLTFSDRPLARRVNHAPGVVGALALGIGTLTLVTPVAEAQARNPNCEIRPQVFVQAYQDVDGDNQYRPNTRDVLLGGVSGMRMLVSAGGQAILLITRADGKGIYTNTQNNISTDYALITAPSETTLNGQPALKTLVEDLGSRKSQEVVVICKGGNYTGVKPFFFYIIGDPAKTYGLKIQPEGALISLTPPATEPVKSEGVVTPTRTTEKSTATVVPPIETPKPTPTPFPAGTPISLDEARARLTATANAAPTPSPTKGPDYMATAQAEARVILGLTPSPTIPVFPTETPKPTDTPKPTPTHFPTGTPASLDEARARVAATQTARVPTPTATEAPDYMATAKVEAHVTPTPFPAGTPISLDEARARLTATANAAPTPTPTKGPDYMATAKVEVGKKQEGWFNLGLPRDIDRLIVGGSIVGELSVLGVLLFLVRYRIAKYRYKKAVAAGGAGAPAAWHRPSLWKVWQWKYQ